jgi:hypothetical protein
MSRAPEWIGLCESRVGNRGQMLGLRLAVTPLSVLVGAKPATGEFGPISQWDRCLITCTGDGTKAAVIFQASFLSAFSDLCVSTQ